MIMEFRTYTMLPGTRADFVAFFEAEAIPRMREVGMTVLGQFSSVTDDSVFAYARTFDSIEERERQYRAFYESEDWLGWMIDVAMGKEESFIVFLGDSQPPTGPSLAGASGAHGDRFTLASSRGPVVEVTDSSITVDGDDRQRRTFTLHPDVRVFDAPNGRGMNPALPVSMAEIRPGDQVLVLGARLDGGQTARQVVKRPPR